MCQSPVAHSRIAFTHPSPKVDQDCWILLSLLETWSVSSCCPRHLAQVVVAAWEGKKGATAISSAQNLTYDHFQH